MLSVAKAQSAPESSTRERAYEYIQRKIMEGELPAGSPVSDLAIARECGISRTPVREAISQLASEGFLQQTPNRGAIVMQFRRADILYLFELREALEVYAIRKAAGRVLNKGDEERLKEVIDAPLQLIEDLRASGRKSLDAVQMRRLLSADMAFHTLLLHAAGNPRILKVVKDARLLMRIFNFPHAGHTIEELRAIWRQHTRILNAVANGLPEEAAIALSEHIQTSMHERLNAFDEHERERSLSSLMPSSA